MPSSHQNRNKDQVQKKQGQCRIIAGKWRGRKISFDDAEGLRPTTDRIRETVFNWLQPYLPNSHCLDCFAGSGALGFEALSRGAESVLLLEQNPKTINNLKKNIEALTANNADMQCVDTLQWLEHQHAREFDVIFLDPPFSSDLLNQACKLLQKSNCLSDNAIIYLEHNIDSKINLPDNWNTLKDKKSGQVIYQLLQNN